MIMRDKRGYRVFCLLACAAVLWGAMLQVSARAQGSTVEYVVKRGDTLYSIAKAHGVTAEQLQTWNSISDPRRLKVGQTLVIHTTSGSGAVSAQAVPQANNQAVDAQAVAAPPLVTTLTVFGVVFLLLIAVLSLFDRRRK